MCDPIGSAIEDRLWAAIRPHIGRVCRTDTGDALAIVAVTPHPGHSSATSMQLGSVQACGAKNGAERDNLMAATE